nr:transposase [Kibdelosporangium sp. MJ126-NF4]
MNSFVERWIQTCRHELLDRTLIWNQRHLLHALREYERFYNSHRPHQGPTTTTTATADHQPGQDHRSRRPPTPTFGRHPQRVPPRSLTSANDIFGKRKAGLAGLTTAERARLESWFPHLRPEADKTGAKLIYASSTHDLVNAEKPSPVNDEKGFLTWTNVLVGDTGIEPVTPTVSR